VSTPAEGAPRVSRAKRAKLAIAAAVVAAGVVLAFPVPRALLASWFGAAPATQLITVSGNIEAHQSVLSFKSVQSRVVELPFDEGQWVTAGTLIARVDDSDYRQQAVIAEANLEVQTRQLAAAQESLAAAEKTVASDEADLAQKNLDSSRNEALWAQGFVSSAARDQSATALKQSTAVLARDKALQLVAARNVQVAKANVESAQEALKLARIVLGYTTLRAPFDGVILVRQAELGEVAMPGSPVVTLADLDHIWLRAYINETDIGKIRHGQPAVVITDSYPGTKYRGRVSFIASKAEFTPKSVETHAERVTLVYRIRIDVDNPTHQLVPGMPADAQLEALPPGSP
jgi:HlyD family secretion protein